MVEPTSPAIDIPVKNGALWRVRQKQELLDLIDRERKFWDWLSQVRANLGLSQDLTNQIAHWLSSARNNAESVADIHNRDAFSSVLTPLNNYLSREVESQTPFANFIVSLRSMQGDLAAKAALAEHLGSAWIENMENVPPETRVSVRRGRMASTLFDLGIEKLASNAVQTASAQIEATFRQHLTKESDANEAKLAEVNVALANIAEEHRTQSDKIGRDWDVFFEQSSKSFGEEVARFQNTENAYKEQMKLRSSVQYWNDKASAHRRSLRFQKFWIAVYAIATLFLVYYYAPPVYERAVTIAKELQEKATGPLVLLAGATIFAMSVLIWIGRMMMRVYFDERERSLDASERATMAETYSALTAEDLITEAERIVVLGSLFRPTSQSRGYDDGAPEALHHALLAKILDAKSGR